MEKYISKSSVLSRDGWTKKAISVFLAKPDKELPNPKFKKAAPMKLYLESRISNIESTEEFKAFKIGSVLRSNSAKKAVKTKRSKLIQNIKNLEIIVPDFSKDELIRQVCEHYNQRKEDWYYNMGGWEKVYSIEKAAPESDPDFLSRICVNYIRHNLTSYEKELRNIYGKVGNDTAYIVLKKRINDAICEKYPWIDYEDETLYYPQ